MPLICRIYLIIVQIIPKPYITLGKNFILDASSKYLVCIGTSSILAEIKGVKNQNPSPKFIAQVWKHIAHNKNVDRGTLILNYDISTDPEDRGLAYTGEYEKELDEIIFIDTRVMFALAMAVIDYGLVPEEASKILLTKGRVTFDLAQYLEEKSKEII